VVRETQPLALALAREGEAHDLLDLAARHQRSGGEGGGIIHDQVLALGLAREVAVAAGGLEPAARLGVALQLEALGLEGLAHQLLELRAAAAPAPVKAVEGLEVHA